MQGSWSMQRSALVNKKSDQLTVSWWLVTSNDLLGSSLIDFFLILKFVKWRALVLISTATILKMQPRTFNAFSHQTTRQVQLVINVIKTGWWVCLSCTLCLLLEDYFQILGNCGTSHPGVDDTHYIFCALTKCPYDVIGSHNMCNEIYISAFENDFIAGNPQSCSEIQIPSNMPQGFKMGYMENRRR